MILDNFWYVLCPMFSDESRKRNVEFKMFEIMKKVLVAVACLMSVGSFSAFASETSVDSVMVVSEVAQDDFVKVEVKDLPEAVTQAVEKAYPDYTVKEAFVAEKEDGKQYKVTLVLEEEEVTALFKENGEEVK